MVQTVRTYSKQWYELRQTRIGASEVASLCNLSPWTPPEKVWADKHGGGFQPDSGINTRIWWGHQEEPHIIEAAMYERWGLNNGTTLVTGTAWYTDTFMVSPDAVVEYQDFMSTNVHSLIEAKTVGESVKSRWTNGPPDYVLMQVFAQMALMGSVDCVIAARIAGAPVKWWTICPQYGEVVTAVVDRFWEHERKPDDWDEWVHDLLVEAGFILKPRPWKKYTLDSLEDIMLVREWAEANRSAREAAAEAALLKSQIQEMMHGCDALEDSSGRVLVTSSRSRRRKTNTELLLQDHPELAEKYEEETFYTTYKPTRDMEGW